MLFSEELLGFSGEVNAAIEELLGATKKNQTDEADLLLVFNYARIDSTHELGLLAGYDHLVHAAREQTGFISEVRKSIVIDNKDKLEKLKETDGLKGIEELSIHAEMLLYLKFWESDMYQRLLGQLARLANGESYDWSLTVQDDASAILPRIRKQLSKNAPKLSALIKAIYKSDLRNIIAHSQYYFAGDVIVPLDKLGEPLTAVTFDEWRGIVSKTLLLHNGIQILGDRVLSEYREKSRSTEGIIEVRVIRNGVESKANLSPMQNRKFWVWTPNLIESGLRPTP